MIMMNFVDEGRWPTDGTQANRHQLSWLQHERYTCSHKLYQMATRPFQPTQERQKVSNVQNNIQNTQWNLFSSSYTLQKYPNWNRSDWTDWMIWRKQWHYTTLLNRLYS